MFFVYAAEFHVLQCVQQNVVSCCVFTISCLAYTKKIEGMQHFILTFAKAENCRRQRQD